MRLETYGITTAPADIRALFDRQMRPEGSWDWFEVLATTTRSPGEEMSVLALTNNQGHALAAMPVVMIDGRVIRGLTSPFTTLFSAPLGGDENAQALGKLLADKVGAKLRLDALDSGDNAIRALQKGLAEGGLVVLTFRHFANWFEHLQDFTDYWDSRDSKLKSTVKRKAAPLLRAGRLSFEWIDMTANWREGADLYNAIYAKSWKPAEPHPRFINTLLERLGPRGIARLAVARIDGAAAAAQIWLVQGTCATIFKLAHDPTFDRQSPGTLLTHWILGQLHEQDGVSEVDFGRGDDAYKRLWLTRARDRVGLLAANPRSLKGLAAIIFDILPSKFMTYLRSGRFRKTEI